MAAPAVARIIDRMAPMVGIAPIDPQRTVPNRDPLITAQLREG